MKLIKATAEFHYADEIYFVLDGRPKKRVESFPQYKANRKKELIDPEEIAYWESFRRQKREIINIVKNYLPINVVYHPDNEADDLIYHICKHKASPEDVIHIISSDSDYIQIINEFDNVTLYNPVAKKERTRTEYDYVSWKAMVGDRSDNIPGVPRIGKVTAGKILKNGTLNERLKDPKFRENYEISYNLIKLMDLKDIEDEIEIAKSAFKIEDLKSVFLNMEFKSLLEEEYLNSFTEVFEHLENNHEG